jgi:uncharacterized membrane protein (UPF0127 family)
MALVATNVDTGEVIASKVSVAATRSARRTGLLRHTSLPEQEGLWIIPCHGVHTCGMRFAIDVLALDEEGRIIDRVTSLKPWRLRLPRRGAVGVLELAAGRIDRTRTEVGHRIEFSVAS